MNKLAFILTFLILSNTARTEELSAGKLLQFCTSTDHFVVNSCRYFILGAVEGIRHGDGAVMGADGQAHERANTHFCMPDDLPQSQLVETFTKTAQVLALAYPDDMKGPAVSIVDAAMHTAFPCGRAR